MSVWPRLRTYGTVSPVDCQRAPITRLDLLRCRNRLHPANALPEACHSTPGETYLRRAEQELDMARFSCPHLAECPLFLPRIRLDSRSVRSPRQVHESDRTGKVLQYKRQSPPLTQSRIFSH